MDSARQGSPPRLSQMQIGTVGLQEAGGAPVSKLGKMNRLVQVAARRLRSQGMLASTNMGHAKMAALIRQHHPSMWSHVGKMRSAKIEARATIEAFVRMFTPKATTPAPHAKGYPWAPGSRPPQSKPSSYRDRTGFYWSDEWRALRYQVLKEHGGCCMLCGRTARHGVTIHVDHIKPRSKYPQLELERSNLQVLCDDCNLGKSNHDEVDWRPAVTASA